MPDLEQKEAHIMFKHLHPRLPSPAMAVAILALVVALSGTAVAAVIISSPSQLAKNVVTGKKIKKNAVTSKKVKDHSLLGKDFKSGQLPAGAKGDKGDAGTSVFNSSIPSGQTVKGVWGGSYATPTANTYFYAPRIGFPVPAPAGLTDAQVSFPVGTAHVAPGDLDATCTGSADVPTAPAGKVCVYVDAQSASVTSLIAGQLDGENTEQSKLGFGVGVTATGAPDESTSARGTWAYTAP
jgi:hypothetical protein